jgi:hypothetical protein
MANQASSMTLGQVYGKLLLMGMQVLGVAMLFRLGGDLYEWMKSKREV